MFIKTRPTNYPVLIQGLSVKPAHGTFLRSP